MNEAKKPDDRRITRTKRTLRDAMIALILEKHFDEITVQDVIDRANVGRSTFYKHFRDKEDLLFSDWAQFLDGFVQHINWRQAGSGRFIPFRELLLHVKDFHPFYRALVRSSKIERIFKTGIDYLSSNISVSLDSYLKDRPEASVPLPILANHLATTLFEQLKWWLDNDMPFPAERMDEIFHELVTPNFRFLNDGAESTEDQTVSVLQERKTRFIELIHKI